MVRNGWAKVDVPSGWVQILRSPRPPSQKWAKSSTVPSAQHRQVQEEAVPRVNPDSSREAVCIKVVKLDQALEVMGDTEGPAVECLKVELEKARNV